MSHKSSQGPHQKTGYSKKIHVFAIIMIIIFLTIIIKYPRIFSPSNIGRNTAPAVTPPAVGIPGVNSQKAP